MIGSHALHGVAWFSVRFLPISTAMRVARDVARVLPPLDRDQAPSVVRRLRGGTCLSRSVAVAARLPGATVAIGGSKISGLFSAHAWVELEGRALSGQTVSNQVLVRLT